jgi:hypothetical protein
VANSHVRSLNASTASWAVERGLRYSVATTVVALVFAGLSSGEDAERLATTAYLAAFFSVIMLVLRRVLPPPPSELPKGQALFPAVFGFSVIVALLLVAAAALATEPSAEGFLIAACIAAVGVATLARSGRIAAAGSALVQGGTIAATLRCLGVAVLITLAIAAILPAGEAGDFAALAYRVVFAGAIALAISLLAPTKAGRFAVMSYDEAVAFVRGLGSWNLMAGVTYAGIAAGGALLVASVAPAQLAEEFVKFAYLALASGAVAIALRWWLQLSGFGQAAHAPMAPVTIVRFRDAPSYVAANFSREKLWDFARASQWAAGMAVAALLVAAALSPRLAKPFVNTGYLAALFAAVTLCVQLRYETWAVIWRRPSAPARRAGLAFVAGSAILAVVGALVVSNPITVKAAVLLCLCWIVVAIGKRFTVTP